MKTFTNILAALALLALPLFTTMAAAQTAEITGPCRSAEDVMAEAEDGEVALIHLTDEALERFDASIQEQGGPAKPDRVTDLVMPDPRKMDVDGPQVFVVVFHDDCAAYLIPFPYKPTKAAVLAALGQDA